MDISILIPQELIDLMKENDFKQTIQVLKINKKTQLKDWIKKSKKSEKEEEEKKNMDIEEPIL